GAFRAVLRAGTDEFSAAAGRWRSRKHAQGVSRGRAEAHGLFQSAGFGCAEGSCISGATGPWTNIWAAQVARVCGVSVRTISGGAVGRGQRGGGEPHYRAV